VNALLSPEARRDLDTIWDYTHLEFGVARADDLTARILATLNTTIATFPDSGSRRPEFGENVRTFPILPYILFCRVESRRFVVMRILHGHRDLQPPLISLLIAG
jgi:toxin ParE1/3/4